jgi:flagellar hook-basal body complex protein FliE
MVDKIDPSVAAGLYKTTQNSTAGLSAGREDRPDFGDLVKTAATESISTLRAGEQASANAIIGNADLTDVVEAVTAAELTLQTVVSVRDRMMGAYQEIMRMSI